MSADKQMQDMMAGLLKTPYMQWQKSEGVPVIEGWGVEDLRKMELKPWARMGGKGAFVHLYGMEGVTGLYVAEIPPGGALEPERHFYEEVICVLTGHGATEVWQDGGPKHMFEWGPWSTFAPPMNAYHRLVNGGREPARFMAVTTAPLVMDVIHNTDFIFNCPYKFTDRYAGQQDYFKVGTKRYTTGLQHVWETNFIPDLNQFSVDEQELKGAGVKITQFELSGNSLIGHVSEWPAGRYHKAHYHGPGAVLLILESEGYVLIWPKEAGIQPYAARRESDVVDFKWGVGSIYCPPAGWFHQHFNTGKTKARQLAVRFGSRKFPVGYHIAAKRQEDGVYISIRNGGTLIEYEDEDAEIRRRYEERLRKNGVQSEMPPVRARAAAG